MNGNVVQNIADLENAGKEEAVSKQIIVNTKEVLLQMLEESNTYFLNKDVWTAKGVEDFFDQYKMTRELRTELEMIYMCLVTELLKGLEIRNYSKITCTS